MSRRRLVWIVPVVAIAAALAAWRLSPGTVPEGQRPLATLEAGSLEALRADFNRDAAQVRIIILLSPT